MLLHNLTHTIDVVVKPILYLILFDKLPLPLASLTHQHAILRLSTKIKPRHNCFPSMPGLWKVSIVYGLLLFTYSRHLFLYTSFVHYLFKRTVLKKFRIRVFFKRLLNWRCIQGPWSLVYENYFRIHWFCILLL